MLGATARKWDRETAQLIRVRLSGEAQMAIELEEIPQRWEGMKAALRDRVEPASHESKHRAELLVRYIKPQIPILSKQEKEAAIQETDRQIAEGPI